MERWRDRVALVTGASVGIGASICKELVKRGIKVVGCARDVEKIENLAKTLPLDYLHAVKCDLRNESEIMNVFNEIRLKYGRIDICINNAGFSTKTFLTSATTEEFRAMLDVNVLALSICTREAIKLMRENNIDDGQIIHISSLSGHRLAVSIPGAAFYAGTKTMVRVLTEGLRQELKSLNSHIRVASISPGITETEFFYRMSGDRAAADQFYSSIQSLTPDDISACVISILSMPAHVDINDIILRPVQQEN